MSNWCENYLGVVGMWPRLKQFIGAASGEGESLSFQKLYPASLSEELVKVSPGKDGGQPEWYIDRMKKWGVKWDASYRGGPANGAPALIPLRPDDDEEAVVIYNFQTAWDPPERLFNKVSKDYPDLRFRLRWAEPGCEKKGVREWLGGKTIRRERAIWENLDWMDWL